MNEPNIPVSGRSLWLATGLLMVVAAGLRAWCLYFSDLPAGDEINTYIFNAQRFVDSFALPSLDNFPFTTLLYGLIIFVLDRFADTLPGLVAFQLVSLGSFCLAVAFLLHSLLRLTRSLPISFFISLFFCCYPGVHQVFRADISLYFLFWSLLTYALCRASSSRQILWTVAIGVSGGLFYMSRSDGVFVFFLAVGISLVLGRIRWQAAVQMVVVFALVIGSFLAMRFQLEGNVGDGASDRALVAFYQAEGLHDNLGGSWQDYTQRGMEKFNRVESRFPGLFGIILSHPTEVQLRISRNLQIIKENIEAICHLPVEVVLLVIAFAFVGRLWLVSVICALPVVGTCAIYLFFYYQPSYLTLLSVGVALLIACGLVNSVFWLRTLGPRPWHRSLAFGIGLFLAALGAAQTLAFYPPRTSTQARYWPALLQIKQLCSQDQTECFYAPPYRGSNAHYIFADRPMCSVQLADGGAGARPEDNLAALRQGGIHYALVGRENAGLWSDTQDAATILWTNRDQDVRILKLQ